MTTNLLKGCEEQFEVMIHGLIEQGFGLCDAFLDEPTVSGLRDNIIRFKEQGEMHPAGIGRKFDFQKNTLVRGDVIKWIERDTQDQFEKTLLGKINEFIHYLNQTCFTTINDYEFHYAWYEQDSFYKRHLDQFRSDRGRKISMVFYLNEDWQTSDGGKLTLYLPDDRHEAIYPAGGRLVIFKSDQTEHEVSPSLNRCRLSIAGWLKSS